MKQNITVCLALLMTSTSVGCLSVFFGGDDDGEESSCERTRLGEPWSCGTDCEVLELEAGGYALNYGSTCARMAGGEVVCWGNSGLFDVRLFAVLDGRATEPARLGDVADAVDVGLGGTQQCLVRAGGEVWCWGDSVANPCPAVGDPYEMERAEGIVDAVEVVAGAGHACARHGDGSVSCWGESVSTLGRGTEPSAPWDPAPILELTGVVDLAAGNSHTCAVIDDGRVACWGNNDVGQLGSADGERGWEPAEVEGVTDASSIAAGGTGTCVVHTDGAVTCWGLIGRGLQEWPTGDQGVRNTGCVAEGWSCDEPTRVAGLPAASRVVIGKEHACALTLEGALWCWGSNRAGQLGDGTIVDRSSPATVPGLSGVQLVSAGRLHTCAMLATGAVLCWGDDEQGQLGVGGDSPDTCISIDDQPYPCALTPQTVSGLDG